MNIIFNRIAANELRDKYIVLELEVLRVKELWLECFCVVDGSKIPADEMPSLLHYTQLHQSLVSELKLKNYGFCNDVITHLKGKFGGELDSFYQIIQERIATRPEV